MASRHSPRQRRDVLLLLLLVQLVSVAVAQFHEATGTSVLNGDSFRTATVTDATNVQWTDVTIDDVVIKFRAGETTDCRIALAGATLRAVTLEGDGSTVLRNCTIALALTADEVTLRNVSLAGGASFVLHGGGTAVKDLLITNSVFRDSGTRLGLIGVEVRTFVCTAVVAHEGASLDVVESNITQELTFGDSKLLAGAVFSVIRGRHSDAFQLTRATVDASTLLITHNVFDCVDGRHRVCGLFAATSSNVTGGAAIIISENDGAIGIGTAIDIQGDDLNRYEGCILRVVNNVIRHKDTWEVRFAYRMLTRYAEVNLTWWAGDATAGEVQVGAQDDASSFRYQSVGNITRCDCDRITLRLSPAIEPVVMHWVGVVTRVAAIEASHAGASTAGLALDVRDSQFLGQWKSIFVNEGLNVTTRGFAYDRMTIRDTIINELIFLTLSLAEGAVLLVSNCTIDRPLALSDADVRGATVTVEDGAFSDYRTHGMHVLGGNWRNTRLVIRRVTFGAGGVVVADSTFRALSVLDIADNVVLGRDSCVDLSGATTNFTASTLRVVRNACAQSDVVLEPRFAGGAFILAMHPLANGGRFVVVPSADSSLDTFTVLDGVLANHIGSEFVVDVPAAALTNPSLTVRNITARDSGRRAANRASLRFVGEAPTVPLRLHMEDVVAINGNGRYDVYDFLAGGHCAFHTVNITGMMPDATVISNVTVLPGGVLSVRNVTARDVTFAGVRLYPTASLRVTDAVLGQQVSTAPAPLTIIDTVVVPLADLLLPPWVRAELKPFPSDHGTAWAARIVLRGIAASHNYRSSAIHVADVRSSDPDLSPAQRVLVWCIENNTATMVGKGANPGGVVLRDAAPASPGPSSEVAMRFAHNALAGTVVRVATAAATPPTWHSLEMLGNTALSGSVNTELPPVYSNVTIVGNTFGPNELALAARPQDAARYAMCNWLSDVATTDGSATFAPTGVDLPAGCERGPGGAITQLPASKAECLSDAGAFAHQASGCWTLAAVCTAEPPTTFAVRTPTHTFSPTVTLPIRPPTTTIVAAPTDTPPQASTAEPPSTSSSTGTAGPSGTALATTAVPATTAAPAATHTIGVSRTVLAAPGSGRTRTLSRTVEGQHERPLPATAQVLPAAVVAAVSVASIGAAIASPSAASRVPAFAYAMKARHCAFEPDADAPSVFEHPIRPAVGTGPKSQFAGAAVASACLVALSGAAVLSLGTSNAAAGRETPTDNAGGKLTPRHVVGITAAIVVAYFSPGVAGAATSSARHGTNAQTTAAIAAGVALCIVIGVVGAFAACLLLRHAQLVAIPPYGTVLRSIETRPYYVATVAVFVDAARDLDVLACRSVYFEDVVFGVLVAVVGGWEPTSSGDCWRIALALALLAALHLAYLAVLRPYAALFDAAFAVANGVCVAGLAVIALASPGSVAFELCVYLQTVLFFVQPLAAVVVALRERKQVAARVEAFHAAVAAPASCDAQLDPDKTAPLLAIPDSAVQVNNPLHT